MNCTLCNQNSYPLFTSKKELQYFHCNNCDLRFLNPNSYLNSEDEFNRYKTHNNNILDLRYQKFVSPAFHVIHHLIKPKYNAKILDFGCGDGPVLSHLLTKEGYSDITLYDPYFYPLKQNLDKKYDIIFSIEVIEHFYQPYQSFLKLKNQLNKNGFLIVMTQLYNETIDFKSWGYINDSTHVCFYSLKTFTWIKNEFQFDSFNHDKNRVCWFKSNNH